MISFDGEFTMASNQILDSVKWTTLTTILTKSFVPISNMVLARLLSPEVFGIIATVNMVVSFADMFTEAGFQKYLIQHQFDINEKIEEYLNVAFWTNLLLAIFLFISIALGSEKLAAFVGCTGYENVLVISALSLPLTSFSAIQEGYYKKNFEFKQLFYLNIMGAFIPFFITIPMAYMGYSYWALVCGNLSKYFLQAVFLTAKSKWKPHVFFSFSILKKMFHYTIWTLFEKVVIWFSSQADVFIIGNILAAYYLGLYRNIQNTVTSLFIVVQLTIYPVMFSAISIEQNNSEKFEELVCNFQKYIAVFAVPLGIGAMLYKDFAIRILLGDQWLDGSVFFGIWTLAMVINISFSYICSEVYRAKGVVKLSAILQILYLIYMIPMYTFAARQSFQLLSITTLSAVIFMAIEHSFFMKKRLGFCVGKMYKNIAKPFICSGVMGIFSIFMKKIDQGTIWTCFSILGCVLIYFASLLLFREWREIFAKVVYKIKR